MNQESKMEAIAIISKSNSVKVSFNVPVNDSYSNVYHILIHESNAKLMGDLISAGFSLSMTPKGLSVNTYL
jgi:hypothetical protein